MCYNDRQCDFNTAICKYNINTNALNKIMKYHKHTGKQKPQSECIEGKPQHWYNDKR